MDQTSSPFNKTNILNIPVRPNRPAPPKKKQAKLMREIVEPNLQLLNVPCPIIAGKKKGKNGAFNSGFG